MKRALDIDALMAGAEDLPDQGGASPGSMLQREREAASRGRSLMNSILYRLKRGDSLWDIMGLAVDALACFQPEETAWRESCHDALDAMKPEQDELRQLVLDELHHGRDAAQKALEIQTEQLQARHDTIARAADRYAKALAAIRAANEETAEAVEKARELLAQDEAGSLPL